MLRFDVLGEVMQGVLDGKINVADNIEQRPLDSFNEMAPQALEYKLTKHVIFTP